MNFYTCPNGEIINTKTGEIVDFVDFEPFPSLSKDTQTLLRHWDGISTEPLGTVPKVIALSRAEERLLRQLRPWKFFKMAVRSDYLRMLDKINNHRFSLYQSIRMKDLRADPSSVYNSIEYRYNHLMAVREVWKDPIALMNKSLAMIDSWKERRIKFGPSGRTEKGRMAIILSNKTRNIDLWRIRRLRYGPRGVKDPEEASKNLSEGAKRKWANGYTHPPGLNNWVTRLERYGPSGFKDPEVKKQADKRGWETRRKRYGPSGRKPKARVDIKGI